MKARHYKNPKPRPNPLDDADKPVYSGPSKSQRKRDDHALQALGKELVELPTTRLQRLGLDEGLLDAILEAQSITSHEGKRRQLQYIGRLMREMESAEPAGENEASDSALRAQTSAQASQHAPQAGIKDSASIRAKLDAIKGDSKAEVDRMHQIENWRDRLLADDAALTKWFERYPASNIQDLRATIRAARKEKLENRAPKHARALFQAIKSAIVEEDVESK